MEINLAEIKNVDEFNFTNFNDDDVRLRHMFYQTHNDSYVNHLSTIENKNVLEQILDKIDEAGVSNITLDLMVDKDITLCLYNKIAHMPNIINLNIAMSKEMVNEMSVLLNLLLTNNKNIKSVTLTGYPYVNLTLDDVHIKNICTGLRNNSTVEKLSFHEIMINNSIYDELKAALLEHTAIKDLVFYSLYTNTYNGDLPWTVYMTIDMFEHKNLVNLTLSTNIIPSLIEDYKSLLKRNYRKIRKSKTLINVCIENDWETQLDILNSN